MIIVLSLAAFAFALGACTTSYTVSKHDPGLRATIRQPVGAGKEDPEKIAATLREIEKRNRTIEDNPKWIRRAYSGLLVRKLNNIPEKEYKDFRKYLDDGAVYIIVHPSFFPFFHYPGEMPNLDENEFIPKSNVIERLLSKKPPDVKFALMQAQERRMRDFLEYMSTREKLVVLIVPTNYQHYRGYKYRRGKDEYTRYLNEVTNFSKSIIFAESRSPNRGYLTDEDGIRLMEFLLSVKAETIYIGGGYIGRCLEDFYVLMTEEFGTEGIYVVPELSDVSPKEITRRTANALLKSDGTIDPAVATSYLLRDIYRIQEVIPKTKNLEKIEHKKRR